jgi:hypothetical protein
VISIGYIFHALPKNSFGEFLLDLLGNSPIIEEDSFKGWSAMGWKEDLLDKANTYCERTGMARSGLAALIMNDVKFFDEIESGRVVRIDTLEKAKSWFEENMPKNLNGSSKKKRKRT